MPFLPYHEQGEEESEEVLSLYVREKEGESEQYLGLRWVYPIDGALSRMGCETASSVIDKPLRD